MRAKDVRLDWVTLAIGVGLLELSLWAGPANYGRAAEPVARPGFLPLPPGAIEPGGWVRDWAIAAREGITGHLDEYHPVYGDAWKGTPVKAPNAAADGTGWPLEQCSYWLDGLVRLGYVLHDETLIAKAKARLDPVVDGVNRGGASFIYWRTNPPAGFNSWAHSHMGRALVAYYQATGERRILEALLKVYRAYPVPMGRLELNGGDVSGLCNLDAMLETYSYTGDRQLLERARPQPSTSTLILGPQIAQIAQKKAPICAICAICGSIARHEPEDLGAVWTIGIGPLIPDRAVEVRVYNECCALLSGRPGLLWGLRIPRGSGMMASQTAEE